MNLAILEKQLQRLADTLSEFNDALVDAQMRLYRAGSEYNGYSPSATSDEN